jgi:hypothetical protein
MTVVYKYVKIGLLGSVGRNYLTLSDSSKVVSEFWGCKRCAPFVTPKFGVHNQFFSALSFINTETVLFLYGKIRRL